jgi:hypothetical protein
VTDIDMRPGELRAMLATIDALTTENAKLRTSFAAAAGREGGR